MGDIQAHSLNMATSKVIPKNMACVLLPGVRHTLEIATQEILNKTKYFIAKVLSSMVLINLVIYFVNEDITLDPHVSSN